MSGEALDVEGKASSGDQEVRCRARRSASVVGRKPKRRHVVAISVFAEGTYLNRWSSSRMANPFRARGAARSAPAPPPCLQQATCQHSRGDDRRRGLRWKVGWTRGRILPRLPGKGRPGRNGRLPIPLRSRIRRHRCSRGFGMRMRSHHADLLCCGVPALGQARPGVRARPRRLAITPSRGERCSTCAPVAPSPRPPWTASDPGRIPAPAGDGPWGGRGRSTCFPGRG